MPRKMIETLPVDMRLHEKEAYRKGFHFISGIDEAGRGPLAGPVVAAAVVLPKRVRLPGVTDSKKLTAEQRECFNAKIRSCALAVGIGVVDNEEIEPDKYPPGNFPGYDRRCRRVGGRAGFSPHRRSVQAFTRNRAEGNTAGRLSLGYHCGRLHNSKGLSRPFDV